MDTVSDSLPSSTLPKTWSKTIASIEWSDRTKNLFEFSNEIETALAQDYFQNPSLYTEEALARLRAFYMVAGKAEGTPPEFLLSMVRSN